MSAERLLTLAFFVRELLDREAVESAVSSLNVLRCYLPAKPVERPAQRSGLASIEELGSKTTLGGVNDPRNESAIDPWLSLIAALVVIDPKLALSAGRTWYAALFEAAFDTDDPIPHRAFAAHVVGIIEAAIGDDLRAEHWLEVGRVEAEFDDDEIATFVRACDFVKAILGRHHLGGDEAR